MSSKEFAHPGDFGLRVNRSCNDSCKPLNKRIRPALHRAGEKMLAGSEHNDFQCVAERCKTTCVAIFTSPHTLTALSASSHFKENRQEPLGNGSSSLPTIFGAFGPRFAYIHDTTRTAVSINRTTHSPSSEVTEKQKDQAVST